MKRNEIHIGPEPLVRLRDNRAIYSVTAAGETDLGQNKDGSPRISSFREGSVVLVRNRDFIVVGPIDPDAALDLATAVCNADPRALTGPQNIHILATALLGLAAMMPSDAMVGAIAVALAVEGA